MKILSDMRRKFITKKSLVVFIIIFITTLITLIVSQIDYKLSKPYSLTITMESETSEKASGKVFYDIGRGYSEKYSYSSNLIPNGLGTYFYQIPEKDICSIRFDPSDRAGKFIIKEIKIVSRQGNPIKKFSLSNLKPIKQIDDIKLSNTSYSFTVSENNDDPILQINNSFFLKKEGVLFYLFNRWWIIVFTIILSLSALAGISFVVITYKSLINKHITIAITFVTVVLFILLVAFGLTGSSLQRLLEDASSIIDSDMHTIIFKTRGVRNDELKVATPWIIAQVNHQPAFPIINSNIGLEGQNMLVAGSGIPVKHLSLISKPSTWGFFFLDLRRALSWSWFFPIFAGLLSLWWLFSLLLPGQSLLSFFLSLLFLFSAYVTVWSMGPIGVVFFPSLGLCLSILILRQKKYFLLPLYGLFLGISIAGFALILYPPWQIPLAYLYIAIFIGIFLRDRLYFLINTKKILTFLLAFIVAGIILWYWWIDAKEAIEILTNTVYPGKRIDCGGGMSIPWLLRGFTNITSIYSTDISNQCEIASFYYLFLPLFVAVCIKIIRGTKEICCTLIPIGLFMIFCLIFMFFGIPEFVAKYTLLFMATAGRADLALGLSYFLLCGIVLSKQDPNYNSSKAYTLLACIFSLIWTCIVCYAIFSLQTGAFAGLKIVVGVLVLIITFLNGLWLIMHKTRYFLVVSLALGLCTVIYFNPLSIATNRLEIKEDIRNILSNSENQKNPYKRVLFLGNDSIPAALYAAGIPNVTGDFMYPQMKFWEQFDPKGKYLYIYNRYQQLYFTLGEANNHDGFIIFLPQLDMVTVTIDGKNFNFALTGAEIVIVPDFQTEQLNHNQSIEFLKFIDGYSWFKVIKINAAK